MWRFQTGVLSGHFVEERRQTGFEANSLRGVVNIPVLSGHSSWAERVDSGHKERSLPALIMRSNVWIGCAPHQAHGYIDDVKEFETWTPIQIRLAGQKELHLLVLTKHSTDACNPFRWVSETLITGVKGDEYWWKPIPKLNIFRRAHLIFTPCLHLDWWSNRF